MGLQVPSFVPMPSGDWTTDLRLDLLRKDRRAAQLPERPSSCLQQFHIKGRSADLCTGGLSPGRIRIGNLCLIGVPLELLADPT